MSFKSLNDILGSLETQAKLLEHPFQQLLHFWSEIVGVAIATHTRPLAIQYDVLRVATSSAAWAQNLTFQRQSLLRKINDQLPKPLVDIRFSTVGWHLPKTEIHQTTTELNHPSYVDDEVTLSITVLPTTKDPQVAFQQWVDTLQTRARSLPLCPECGCATPIGELQRWQVCSICAAKRW